LIHSNPNAAPERTPMQDFAVAAVSATTPPDVTL
jgi:hypothetical protein